MANTHPSEEVIEQFCLNQLEGSRLARFEEHLLVCPECQVKISTTDTFISNFRAASSALVNEDAKAPVQLRFRFSTFACVAALIAAIAIALLMPRSVTQRPQVVALIAQRSGSPPTSAIADVPIKLQLDATGLVSGSLQVDIADWDGRVVSSTRTTVSKNAIVVAAAPLRSGAYWVRIVDNDQILREFSLTVK